jgi:uncharacterized protein (TIGR00156 family)
MKMNLRLVLWVLFLAAFGFIFTGCRTMGGYVGPASVTTVAEALNSVDDTLVKLQGKIGRKMDHDKYMFSDTTGDIAAEIDFWVWKGLTIDENDLVEISGEVDEEDGEREIDVKSIRKI